MIRTRDAALVNRLVGTGDFSELLAEPLHVCLIEGESGAFFAWRGPGIYEVHLFFAVRGREALNLCRAMIDHMRGLGAVLFWALIPIESRKVRLFARWMGWRSRGIMNTRGGLNELFVENGECLQQS